MRSAADRSAASPAEHVEGSARNSQRAHDYLVPVAIIGVLFFLFGFVTWLNGPLIIFVKLAFGLDTDAKAFLVTTAFYMAYFFLALPAAWLLERVGMKRGMALGLLIMACGSFVFGTYATGRNYAACLAGLFVIGSGLSLLQTAANPYISIVGPIASAAQRICIMGICNKVAGFIAPIVIGLWVFNGMTTIERQVAAASDPTIRDAILNHFAAVVYRPYMGMSAVLVVLAAGIVYSPLPDLRGWQANTQSLQVTPQARPHNIWQFPHLWLGVLCIFLYMGAEVMAGDAIGIYARGFHVPIDVAKFLTSATLAAMVLGYLVGWLTIPTFISQERALAVSAVLGVVLSLLAFVTTGYVSVACVAALGFANAPMWPAIFPLSIRGLGALTEKGSALLIMGVAGGAIIPRIFAELKERYQFQAVFLAVMLPIYLYILFYGLRGYRSSVRASV
jgi:MFS transporter, FHS family, L-fucose permease